MPTFQYDRHAVPCVLGSVYSMLPTFWISFFDSGLNGLYAWFCRRSCWTACRSGWFSTFWINSRTLVLCACFTTECGNPGIRKSMFTSFSIFWLMLQVRGMTIVLLQIFSHREKRVEHLIRSLFFLSLDRHEMSIEHRHEDNPSSKIFWCYTQS